MLLNCFDCRQLGLVVEFYSMTIVYESMFSIPICVIPSGSGSCFLLTVPCFHSICFNDEHVKFNCLDIVIEITVMCVHFVIAPVGYRCTSWHDLLFIIKVFDFP